MSRRLRGEHARRVGGVAGACVAVALVSGCGDVAPLGSAGPVAGVDDDSGVPVQLTGTGVAEREGFVPLGPPYPIILVHGFSGWDDIGPVGYFFQVKQALEDDGDDVTTPALPPYTSSDERARVLANVIDDVLARTGKREVHLIGHSQGGMDIRRVVGGMGYGAAGKIASVTTISTPHQGTAVADLAASAPDGVLNPAGQLLQWLLGAGGAPPDQASWASDDTSDAWTPDLADSIRSLTPAAARELAAHNRIPADIPFFTVAGVSNLRSLDNPQCAASLWGRGDAVDDTDPLLVASGTYLSFTDGGDVGQPTPNDGLVTVASARAPESTFLGCVPADHFDEIGQVADVIPDIISGWDHVAFYRRLVAQIRTTEQ